MIRFFPFTKFHGKDQAGSTMIRVDNLLKYWPEAGIYQYGENPDVLIFQKVYVTETYTLPLYFENLKILDVCDPDWLSPDSVLIKQTVDAMDAVVTPTEKLAEFIRQLTDKPVKVIKDRFDLSQVPPPKKHTNLPIKTVVWFGYRHNAEVLRTAMPLLARLKLKLLVISDDDPQAWRWSSHVQAEAEKYKELYIYRKYQQETIYQLLQTADVCILPKGFRVRDRYKSENKTIVANLAGLPVAYNDGDLEELQDPVSRAEVAKEAYNKAKAEYDCRQSVVEWEELIEELKSAKKARTKLE